MTLANSHLSNSSRTYDVVVVGGGNAGLCAAISARQAGASVLLLEQAPRALRGGSTRHARNLRVKCDPPSVLPDQAYCGDEYWADLAQATAGHTDENLARLMIEGSAHIVRWMEQCGIQFEKSRIGNRPSRKTAFLLGGGKALLNAYYRKAERIGVDIAYDTEVLSVPLDNGVACEIHAISNCALTRVRTRAVVVSCGGSQANTDWLQHYWGDAANRFVIRGARQAKGRVLASLLDQNVVPIGEPGQCHMVAVDARAPKFDGGIVTRLDCVPYSVVVDRNGQRFHDEGEEVGPRRFAVWGKLVARCPDQIAYAILDSKAEGLFRPSFYPPIRTQTISELAVELKLNPADLATTIHAFNAAITDASDRKAGRLARAEDIVPPKSKWAMSIDTPPFSGYPLRPGVTFSYLGVKVDDHARVIMASGRPAANVFAAGQIMLANILASGYLAGVGMTLGTVFGQIAGRCAVRAARSWSPR
ncbi:FAD-dependent tricarballylate dehydrogenase TcuA [Bradyrhizobium sp. UNPA324]|uniref:FAD-dependent tricarballylate dehydrogenase TcuA n=1 Tax=Bradyrhizobium sp. UNPA324 TaxID=1141174 RepID=UPI0011507A84|nr:FAD-dependent tricarballylate dehydrogenase TcuA [Bradyrhizobium sp. UNPA324]TQF33747.1 hypothetical protein UNPA324_32635 [Bradyrhizobium sp. UNPA324]